MVHGFFLEGSLETAIERWHAGHDTLTPRDRGTLEVTFRSAADQAASRGTLVIFCPSSRLAAVNWILTEVGVLGQGMSYDHVADGEEIVELGSLTVDAIAPAKPAYERADGDWIWD